MNNHIRYGNTIIIYCDTLQDALYNFLGKWTKKSLILPDNIFYKFKFHIFIILKLLKRHSSLVS